MRLTKKENGQVSIPGVPTPIPISWGSKKYKHDYMKFILQYSAMVEKLAAYEDATEVKCQSFDYILKYFPYQELAEVPQEEWERLHHDMEIFDKEDQYYNYNLEAFPLCALVLRELLSTPFIRERREICRRYVPTFVLCTRWWDKLLDKYGLKNIKNCYL